MTKSINIRWGRQHEFGRKIYTLLFDEEEEFGRYYNMINEVSLICRKVGIPFKFEPHSPEKEAEYIKKYVLPEIERAADFYGELRKNNIVMGITYICACRNGNYWKLCHTDSI